jgi:hypothetical protein
VDRAYLTVDSVALQSRYWHRVGCLFVAPEAGQNLHDTYFYCLFQWFLTLDHKDLPKFAKEPYFSAEKNPHLLNSFDPGTIHNP